MKRKTTEKKPPLEKGDIIHLNIDNYDSANIVRQNITAKYTAVDLKTKKESRHVLHHFYDIEARDFRKGLKDPNHTYTILYGATGLIKRKGETYYKDLCWFSIGCKGVDYDHAYLVTTLSIDNYGKYIFWEASNPEPGQHRVKGYVFHPEEVTRFNKDMVTLFRVVKKNPACL